MNSDNFAYSFTWSENSQSPTANTTILLATPDLASHPQFPTPDFVIPATFFGHTNTVLTFNFGEGSDIVILNNGVPTDGTNSVDRNGTVQTATPTNYNGNTVTFPLVITPPVITSPTNGATITTDTITITGTATANLSIEIFEDTTSLGTTTADANGDWQFPTPSLNAPGNRTFTATASYQTDTSALSNSITVAIAITVLTTPTYLSQFGSQGSDPGQLFFAESIVLDSDNNIYVADTFNNRVQILDSSGSPLLAFGASGTINGGFNNPYGIALDSDNNIYVADTGNNRIQKFSSSGVFILKFDSSNSSAGQLDAHVA